MPRKPSASAPVLTCRECGKEFQPTSDCATRTSKFCSRECGWANQKHRADASLPPRDEVVELHRDQGMSVSALARHYGKSQWWASRMLRSLNIEQRQPPKGGTKPCKVCGTEFYASPSGLRTRKYCSIKCRSQDLGAPSKRPGAADKISRAKMGAQNPMFKDGFSPDTVRRQHFNLKLKGETCCRNCGATGQLHMHHVIPRSMFRAGIKELRNGIPLCPRCHHGWHHRTVTIYRDVFTNAEWAYLTGVTLHGQNILAWLDDRYPPRVTNQRDAGEQERRPLRGVHTVKGRRS